MNLILPIGDIHDKPEHNKDRLKYLSKFIVDKQPTHILIMGDFLTLDCLSFWDKDKRRKMEGKRYVDEVESANQAMDIIFNDVELYNRSQVRHKKKQYKPELIYLMGNHEDRLDRYLDYNPTMAGMIGIEKDLDLIGRGFTIIPYREYTYINGIAFTHIPFNGAAPISGINICRKAQMVTVDSIVFAHTHNKNEDNIKRHGQTQLQQVFNCGCYFEEIDDYMHGRMENYWKGVCLLKNYKPGAFSKEEYSLDELNGTYK